jgi:hypothetical protein
MRTFACVVFVLYLGLAGTAVAHGGAGAGGGGTGTGLGRGSLMTVRPYGQHLKRKTVARGTTKANHHHHRPSGYAAEVTPRHNVSSETSTTQMPINKAYTLSPGLPLLGLDPRSPSTWALYNQMLPPLFSEASTSTPVEPGR